MASELNLCEETSDSRTSAVDIVSLRDNLVCVAEGEEKEELELNKLRAEINATLEPLLGQLHKLEGDKSSIDAETTHLKVKEKLFQKDHSDLRNNLTQLKRSIYLVQQAISDDRRKGFQDLTEFEKQCDEIAALIRDSPALYSPEILIEQQKMETLKYNQLKSEWMQLNLGYKNWCKEKGLKPLETKTESVENFVNEGTELDQMKITLKNLQVFLDGFSSTLGVTQSMCKEDIAQLNGTIAASEKTLAELKARKQVLHFEQFENQDS